MAPPRSPSREPAAAATERTALLPHDPAPAPAAAPPLTAGAPPAAPPLPRPSLSKPQLLLLCAARTVEPIAFFSIFPYIAAMVQRAGDLPASDLGFYSGLIESLFSAVQVLVLLPWGRLADRLGRRPVLLVSLAGTACAPALFGLAASLPQMVAFRCLAGLCSGGNLVVRTMIGDRTTPETQAWAFSWFAFAGNLGIFAGPLLGGALADPAKQFPRWFAADGFFARYPYALPGFAVGAIGALVALACLLFLDETLESKEKEDSNDPGAPLLSAQPSDPQQKMSVWQLVRAPGVMPVLWTYGHVMMLAFAFTAILPVALYTPISLGGIGWSTLQISVFMAVQGGSQALWLVLAFPLLQRRIGTKGVLYLCALVYPFFFAGYILLNTLLRVGTQASVALFWTAGAVVALVGPGVSMAFTGVQLALNDVSPDHHLLGTLNAIALTFTSAIRSVAPAISTTIYAVGVRHQILGGHLAWVLLIPVSAALTIALRRLPDKGR